jgi:hypothetical protein
LWNEFTTKSQVIFGAVPFCWKPARKKPLDILEQKFLSSQDPHLGIYIALRLSDYTFFHPI